jgi:hypothetical protein
MIDEKPEVEKLVTRSFKGTVSQKKVGERRVWGVSLGPN